MKIPLVFALLASSPAFAASPLAYEARVVVSGQNLVAGAANAAADASLDCAAPTVQRTIRRCKLSPAVAAFATCLGRRVDGVTLNIHFQGDLINMFVEFASGNGVDAVLGQLKSAFGKEPRIQYWADDSHLYASYIWIDGEAEVEVTKVVKGDAGDGKVRMYVSSLLAGRPLNPDDSAPAPVKKP